MTTDEICWKKVKDDLETISFYLIILITVIYLPTEIGKEALEPTDCTNSWDKHADGSLTPTNYCTDAIYWSTGLIVMLCIVLLVCLPYLVFELVGWLYKQFRKRYCMTKEECSTSLEENHPQDEGEVK